MGVCSSTQNKDVVTAKDVKLEKNTNADAGKSGIAATPAAADATNSTFDKLWPEYEKKMKAEGLSDAAIAAFRYNFSVLTSGANLMIPESTIKPVDSLPDYASLSKEDPELLKATVRKADRTRTRAGRMRASHSPREGASPRDRASYCASYTLR